MQIIINIFNHLIKTAKEVHDLVIVDFVLFLIGLDVGLSEKNKIWRSDNAGIIPASMIEVRSINSVTKKRKNTKKCIVYTKCFDLISA